MYWWLYLGLEGKLMDVVGGGRYCGVLGFDLKIVSTWDWIEVNVIMMTSMGLASVGGSLLWV